MVNGRQLNKYTSSSLLQQRKNIFIQSPYFVPDQPLTDALANAALSGVDVKIMITGVPDKKNTILGSLYIF